LVSTLVAGISDPDGKNVNKGIALLQVSDNSCTFYYSTNNGNSWKEIKEVSESRALLLSADGQTRIFAKPKIENENGVKSNQIVVKAWDGTSLGKNGDYDDLRNTDRADSAFSAGTATIGVNIIPVNDAPTLTNLNSDESYTEDTPYVLRPMQISDIDSTLFRVTMRLTDPQAGTLSTNRAGNTQSSFNPATATWEAAGPANELNQLLGSILYRPSENYYKDFKILTSVSDGTDLISGEKQFKGIAINDAPIASDDVISVTREPSFISAEAILSNDSDVEDVNTLRIQKVRSRDESKYTAIEVRGEDGTVVGIQFKPIDKNLDGIAILDYEIIDVEGLTSKGVINLLVGGISIGSQSEVIREQAIK
jgi:hypothetical protein